MKAFLDLVCDRLKACFLQITQIEYAGYGRYGRKYSLLNLRRRSLFVLCRQDEHEWDWDDEVYR